MVLLSWLPTSANAHPTVHDRLHLVNEKISRDPGNPDLYVTRAHTLREDMEWDAALADYARAAELGGDMVEIDVARGELLVAADRAEEAFGFLDRVLAQEPEHRQALIARSRGRALADEPSLAAADLILAITGVERPMPDLYLDLVRHLAAAGRIDEALSRADEGLEKSGPLSALQLEAIAIEARHGRVAEALERVERYSAESRVPERFLVVWADLLVEQDRRQEAREIYEAALLRIRSRHPRARSAAVLSSLEERTLAGLRRLETISLDVEN